MRAEIVIPVFNESATLASLAEQILAHMPLRPFGLLFVNDGSTDDSLDVIRRLAEAHEEIGYLNLSRNAGKTQALASAFRRTTAEVVITMDADLQDDPAELPKLLDALEGGLDLVCGWKENRRDPVHKTFPSRVFNSAMASVFGLELHDINTGFKAMRGELARALPLTGDRHRFIPVLAKQLGYTVGEVPVVHHPRRHGHSKYGMERYYEGLRDAFALWRERGHIAPGTPDEPADLVAEARLAS